MAMPGQIVSLKQCNSLTAPPPWVSHIHDGPPERWTLPPATPCTIPLVLTSVESSTVILSSTPTGHSTSSIGFFATSTASTTSPTSLALPASTTFLTSTVLLTSSQAETTLATSSGSPALGQTSDTGDHLLKVVIAVSVVALVAFLALFMLTLKKQSPVRYERVVAYCPLHIIWSYILLLFAATWPRQHQHQNNRNRPHRVLSDPKSEALQSKSHTKQDGSHVAPHAAVRLLEEAMNNTNHRRGEQGVDGRGRSRAERIQGLGIDLVNPAPVEQPGLGRKVLRSISRSGNNKPFRVSFLSDHKSPRASDSSVAWQRHSPFSDEALTPPQPHYSPHFNLRISDYSMASTFSELSTEDLSTYHSNLARLKAERAERVKQLGLNSSDSLRVERTDPRRSGARKSFALSPGRKLRTYLGASPVSPEGDVSRFHEQKSKFGNQSSEKRMGIDALKAWWDKLGNEQE